MTDFSTRIRCAGCEKNLLSNRFSENAKKKYQESRSAHQRNPRVQVKAIQCVSCNPSARQEMKCVMCDQTMSLDRFSKAQRRKTDDAHCLHCQQEKSDREADFDKEVEEVNIMDEIKKLQLGGSNSYYSSIASATHRSRSAQSQSDQYETDTNPGSPSWAHGNDAVSLADTETSRPSSTSTRIVTGTGWDGFAGDGRSTTARSVTSGRSNNPGFVKQNAVRKDVHQKVAEQLAREHERQQQEREQVERDESDNDSEASDDPY